MKEGFTKYIFIILVIIIICLAVYKIYQNNSEKPEENIVNEVVQDTIKSNDIRIGITNFDTMNPLLSNNRDILQIDRLIYEPLITLDENYQAKLCLASECSKIDNKTYVIKIDTNKRWQDGTPFMAKDIQFTIDRLKEGKSIYSYNVQYISSIEILDASTVKIYLSQEQPFFEYYLTFPILCNSQYINKDMNTSTEIPLGTGMYKIESIEGNNIKLTKNEKWWNRGENDPKAENITINIYSQMGEVYNSFKLGNIDFINTSNTSVEDYIGTIGYGKNEYKGRELDYISLNCNNNILKYPEVRKAISYLIDKNNIVSSVYNNKKYISDFPLDYGSFLYTEQESQFAYDIEKAKQVLTDAGWVYKNRRWQKTENRVTTRISLNVVVEKDNENRVKVAENIIDKLNEIGLNAKIEKVSQARYNQYLENKNYDIIITGILNSYTPDLNSFFGNGNIANYSNQEMTTILNEVNNITDQKVLIEKYKRIVEIYNNDVPYIFLYRNRNIVVHDQNLTGEIYPTNYNIFNGIKTWVRR